MSDPTRRIYNLIQSLWQASVIQGEYIGAMSNALSPTQPVPGEPTTPIFPWVLLPCWCCESAGGHFSSAEPVAAAWALLYAALHILDDIEDGDTANDFGPLSGASLSLNASTGLIMSVPLLIQKLCSQDVSDALIEELIADLHLSVLKMCGGQHYDLTRREISLETAWQIAELKSGAFFSLASRTGARLATGDSRLLHQYTLFGHHLGMLIQIGDDWSDLRPQGSKSDLARGSETTLPVAYAMSVLPQAERARLRTCLQQARCSATAETEALCLIEGAGTELYLATKAIQHRRQAEAALEKAGPPSNARDELTKLLSSKAVPSRC